MGDGFDIDESLDVPIKRDEGGNLIGITVVVNIEAENGFSNLKVKIDSGTQPGKVLRLRNKGLPSINSYGTGDLLVNVSVYIPETLSSTEKETLNGLENSPNFQPNKMMKEKIFSKFKHFFD